MIHFASAEDRQLALEAARTTKKAHLQAAARELLRKDISTRDRKTEIQVQLPRDLRDRLGKLAGQMGQRKGNQLILDHLGRLFDLQTGKRRTRWKREGGRRIRKFVSLPDRSEFKSRGRQLAGAADLVRYTVNCRRRIVKIRVKKLIDSLDMTASQFFSALIERACRLGTDQPGPSILPGTGDELSEGRGVGAQ